MQTAIDQATQRGVLFVASAGNEGANTDVTPHYPSSLPDDIVLAVGASTRTDTLWYALHGMCCAQCTMAGTLSGMPHMACPVLDVQ